MLSRTAGNLYWVGRYIERADFLSRLIDATLRLASLPSSYGGMTNAWELALEAAWQHTAHAERGLPVDEFGVGEFLTVDPVNPSSIRRCLEAARANARAVRTALTLEGWEAINGAWLDVQKYGTRLESREGLVRLLETVKASMLAFDGAAHRTMLRGDAYWFIALGSAVERADNTARLLDVKYHLLLPRGEKVGGSPRLLPVDDDPADGVGADRLSLGLPRFGQAVAGRRPADPQPPDSAEPGVSCYEEILRRLDQLSTASARRGPAHRLAAAGYAALDQGRIDAIYSRGLHEFLRDFIADNNRLGAAIAEQYLF